MSALLDVRGLDVSYGHIRAVHGLSFSVSAGSGFGIIGANGAGKTSTLRALLGLIRYRAESIEFDGHRLDRTKAHRIVELGVGYVPEGRHVFSGLTVRKNLLLGAYRQRWNAEVESSLRRVYELFPVLEEFEKRLAGALSGGQQQMLAIGRALMSRPKLLVLDEPSMGLGPVVVNEISSRLAELRAQGLALLLVEQNAQVTFSLAEECIVLENGRGVKQGSSATLREDPEVRRIYLGI
ncbi:MAG TPA: ABC transporter ATP-binding protein [Gaiellaceae bacterium]|jgi:branched-chain amino acid transport system ATP-binding protein